MKYINSALIANSFYELEQQLKRPEYENAIPIGICWNPTMPHSPLYSPDMCAIVFVDENGERMWFHVPYLKMCRWLTDEGRKDLIIR